MPDPGSIVTRVPLPRVFSRGTGPGLSAQGYHRPPRSVSSMRTLLPLMLAPSSPSAAAPNPSCTADREVQIGGPIANCDFPELLVRDLENSEALFASKAMTAGCPSAGLATSTTDRSPELQVPNPPQPSYPPRQLPAGQPRPLSLVMNEMKSDKQFEDDAQLGTQGDLSDSSSVASAMEPPLIRTRGQSITTAATSVSGRCSSLSSHKPFSPSTSVLPSSSSKLDRNGQSTWYDAEAAFQQDEPSTVDHDRDSISAMPQIALGLGHGDCSDFSPEYACDISRAGVGTALHFPVGFSGYDPRLNTSTAHVRMEKPRIIDIPPATTYPERSSSLTRIRYTSAPTNSGPNLQKPVDAFMTRDPVSGYGGNSRTASVSGRSRFAAPTGRAVIDLSEPPPTALTSGVWPLRHIRAPSPPTPSTYSEPPHAELDAEPSTNELANVRHWTDASAESSGPAQMFVPYRPSVSTPGIPLPPEVMESLRVSISCFPETMLLSSSLSIETIRTYSKKIKHRTGLDQHLQHNSNEVPFPSPTPGNTTPSKRWNLGWLSQSQRGRQRHQQQHGCQHLPRNLPPLDASTSSLASQNPVMPSWAPIKNIFPAASDYLCDALYAHLIAYNYITSLCPTRPAAVPAARPARRNIHGHHGASLDNDPSRNVKIPQKAASVLGMEDPITAAAMHHQHGSAKDDRRRGLLLGRRMSHFMAAGENSNRPPGQSGRRSGSSSSDASLAMRGIQTGLARCITLLVATLKRETTGMYVHKGPGLGVGMVIEGEGERGGEEVDAVLMRALCETVRCAEDKVECW